jgi:hypothetical protein
MAKEKRKESEAQEGFHVRFNLLGLVVFSVSLILATGLLSLALEHPLDKLGSRLFAHVVSASPSPADDSPPAEVPPWGELIAQEVEIECPEEYLSSEASTNKAPTWTFEGMKPEQVRALMLACGLTAQQVEHALSPQLALLKGTNTIIKPDEELVFSLAPDTRGKLYAKLARNPANTYMCFPFCFPGESFDNVVHESGMDGGTVAMLRSLLYRRGDALLFSDFEAAARRAPAGEQRLQLLKALTHQPAVIARLRIRPTTDIDKVLGYWAWAPGVRSADTRSLLESLKNLPDGGSVSLLYLLPPFARERLYSFPLPMQPDAPFMDCHWSTLNFFNETPDNRFADVNYVGSYLAANCHRVAMPTHYGDLIFLMNDKGQAVHSAVYVADDIVFTKNGGSFEQPWMLMRLKKLMAAYSAAGTGQVVCYRNKNT